MNWEFILKCECWLSGHSRFRYDRQLQANERLSWEYLAEQQWKNLHTLLNHAYGTVPHYRAMFDDLKITPGDIRSWTDYASLPILTKDIIRQQGAESFCSTAFPRSSLSETTTSGSTGEPLKFFREREYEEWRMAGSWRAWRWGGWRPGDKMAWIWREYWPNRRLVRLQKRVNWWMTRRKLFNVFDLSDQAIDQWIEELREYRPKYILGFPSAISHFAKAMNRRNGHVSGIKAIFTNGEMLQSGQRELIEQVFQTRVFNVYGSSEVHPIAAECNRGQMHISADLTVPELIEDGTIGEHKRIVLTPLFAFGMPLLRYEIGDLALRFAQKCSCGLPFPVLEGLVGRATDVFLLPDGRQVHGQILIAYMSQMKNIERFQFRKITKNSLHLYVVKGVGHNQDNSDQLHQVCTKITKEMGVVVHYEYVPDIPRAKHGKYRYTINEVDWQ